MKRQLLALQRLLLVLERQLLALQCKLLVLQRHVLVLEQQLLVLERQLLALQRRHLRGRIPGGAFKHLAALIEIEKRLNKTPIRMPRQRLCHRLFAIRAERLRARDEEHVNIGKDGRDKGRVAAPHFHEEPPERRLREEKEVLSRHELPDKGSGLGREVLERGIWRHARRLDDQDAVGLQQLDASPNRSGRIRQMLEHIEQRDDIERPRAPPLRLDRPVQHPDIEGLTSELDHPRAQLDARSVEAGQLQQSDRAPVGTAQLERARRGELEFQDGSQPPETSLRQVRSSPLEDSRVAVVFRLMREPVVAPVQPFLRVGHVIQTFPRNRERYEGAAGAAPAVLRAERGEICPTTPALNAFSHVSPCSPRTGRAKRLARSGKSLVHWIRPMLVFERSPNADAKEHPSPVQGSLPTMTRLFLRRRRGRQRGYAR